VSFCVCLPPAEDAYRSKWVVPQQRMHIGVNGSSPSRGCI